MGYLFFFISLLYSFIFYLFYIFSHKKDIYLQPTDTSLNIINLSFSDKIIFSSSDTIVIQSIFWNLIYEVILFFIIGLFLFFYFTSFKKEEKIQPTEHVEVKTHSNITKILQYFSYYIGFILFYLSVYLISSSFDFITFSTFIFIINILIYLLFFASKFSKISKDFLRINSILFSLFYIINYVYIIIIDQNYFVFIDFINTFLILLIFPTLLYHDKKIAKKDNFDYATLVHFSVYVLSVFLFYFYFYVLHQNLIFWMSFIATLFGIIWFEILPKVHFLHKDKIILRYIGIIMSYLGIIFWIIYLSFSFSIIILAILLLQIFYHFYIHKKYTNYISLFLWVFLFYYVIYYIVLYYEILDFKSIFFLVLGLILSFISVIFTYIFKAKILLDYYIIHLFAHIVNIVSIINFLIFNKVEILHIWVLLLLESIYFFLSYNKLNPQKKAEKKHTNPHDVHISSHH